MGNTVEMSGAIVPKNVDNGEILKMGPCDVKERFGKGEGWVDDNMDCH